ncbi:MAG: homoserine kinase [Desulfurococcales archaeon]|nr:homoserine kinase [Desulfurococcales archaeon]
MPEGVRVRAYSSSANLGPGFDALAVALDAYSDVVEAWLEDKPGVRVVVEGDYAEGSGGGATARRAVEELLKMTGSTGVGVGIRLVKGVPPGRGLGSSGASAAAAVVAASRLLGLGLAAEDLVKAAGAGESMAAGAPHYDNVAASLLGGFVVIAPGLDGGLRVSSIDARAWFAVVTPMDPVPENKTRVMRSVLPNEIPLGDAVSNWSRLAMMVSAIHRGEWGLVGEMMMGDGIVEPRRARFIPCYSEARRAALEAGALGFTISGAGPSVIALARDRGSAARVLDSMLSSCSWRVEPLGVVASTAPGAVGAYHI